MATRNTIVLRSSGPLHEERGTSVYAVTPGMLVELTAVETYQPHSTAGDPAVIAVVRDHWENTSSSATSSVDTAVPVADEFIVVFPHLGDKINFYTSDTIAAGGWVESDGAGGVRAYGSGYRLGMAWAASDLSGTVGRVEVIIAPIGA